MDFNGNHLLILIKGSFLFYFCVAEKNPCAFENKLFIYYHDLFASLISLPFPSLYILIK